MEFEFATRISSPASGGQYAVQCSSVVITKRVSIHAHLPWRARSERLRFFRGVSSFMGIGAIEARASRSTISCCHVMRPERPAAHRARRARGGPFWCALPPHAHSWDAGSRKLRQRGRIPRCTVAGHGRRLCSPNAGGQSSLGTMRCKIIRTYPAIVAREYVAGLRVRAISSDGLGVSLQVREHL